MLRSLAHHAHRFQCAYLGGLQITDDPSSGSLISAGFGLWSFGRLFLGQRAIIWRTMGGAAYHGNCACFLFVTVLRRAVRMLGIGFSRDAVIMDMDQGCSRLAAHALYLYCRPWECTGLCPHISRIGLVLNQRKVSKLRWRGSEPSAYIPSLISTNRRNTSCSKRPCAHESRRCVSTRSAIPRNCFLQSSTGAHAWLRCRTHIGTTRWVQPLPRFRVPLCAEAEAAQMASNAILNDSHAQARDSRGRRKRLGVVPSFTRAPHVAHHVNLILETSQWW